jgi:dolichyl-diphosphooligosaccharide--protein glycosyltransferase
MASRKKSGQRNLLRGISSITLPEIRFGKTILSLIILSIIVAIAVILRILPLRYGAYFTGYDPLFQYRATKYVVENGFDAWFRWHDSLSWYPIGRNIPMSAYLGVPFSGAIFYYVIRSLGIEASVHDACLFFPVLMGSLTCIVVYFLSKDLGGRVSGLFAAFFMAISPAFLARTYLGFYDTENIGIFGMVLTSLLFLR